MLQLAREHPFARRLVNSGRLSTPATLAASPLNTPDEDHFDGAMVPGAPCTDAPVRIEGREGWLLPQTAGGGFTIIHFGDGAALGAWPAPGPGAVEVQVLLVVPHGVPTAGGWVRLEEDGLVSRRFDATPGTTYLLRPDQHVCARWRRFDPAKVRAAIARATCNA